MINFKEWEGFEGRIWKEEVNVRDFIQKNYTPYDGDESFLAGPTEATNKLWGTLQKLQKEERAKGGVLDMETEVVSSLTAYGPGYIDESLKDLEQIVGLQTDKPLKRAFMPYGGIKMAEQACTTYGYQPSEELHKIFTDYTPKLSLNKLFCPLNSKKVILFPVNSLSEIFTRLQPVKSVSYTHLTRSTNPMAKKQSITGISLEREEFLLFSIILSFI